MRSREGGAGGNFSPLGKRGPWAGAEEAEKGREGEGEHKGAVFPTKGKGREGQEEKKGNMGGTNRGEGRREQDKKAAAAAAAAAGRMEPRRRGASDSHSNTTPPPETQQEQSSQAPSSSSSSSGGGQLEAGPSARNGQCSLSEQLFDILFSPHCLMCSPRL